MGGVRVLGSDPIPYPPGDGIKGLKRRKIRTFGLFYLVLFKPRLKFTENILANLETKINDEKY